MSRFNNNSPKLDDNMKAPTDSFRVPLSKNVEPAKTKVSKFSDGPQASNGKPRRSKFSDRPPSDPAPVKIDPKQAAAAAAARINASLRAKGKLSDETLLKPAIAPVQTPNTLLNIIQISPTTKVFDSYVAKIDINDLPLSTRTHFAHFSIQDAINKETGAAVSTKGQYLTTQEKSHLTGIEKQLHLFIQSPVKLKVDMALSKLRDMISKHPTTNNAPLSNLKPSPSSELTPNKPVIPMVGQPTLPTGSFIQEKVFVGMDSSPSGFDLRTKLIGFNYTNFNFIANSTAAKVILRGRGSGFIEPTSGREAFEAMYVFISHPTQTGVDAAKKLVLNLIETVKTDLASHISRNSGFGPQPQIPPPINPYSSYPQPQAPMFPPMPNPYFAPPIASVPPYSNPYPLAPPGTTVPPVAPPPATNIPDPLVPPGTDPDPPMGDLMPPPAIPIPPKPVDSKQSRKRCFKEEQPDDSDVLGYKQFSAENKDKSSSEEKQKKQRRTFKENTVVEEVPVVVATKPDEDLKPSGNLPFWMSHNYE